MALGRVHAQPLRQAVERLADAEESDRDDLRPAAPGGDRGVRAGDQHPPGQPLRPESVQILRLRQVVEDQQPRLAGLFQPADEAGGDRFGRAGGLKAGGGRRSLHATGKHRGPASGGDPDQRIYGRRAPERFRNDHGDLGLAARAEPVLLALGEGRTGYQRHGRTGHQRVYDPAGGIGPVGKSLGQRRHFAHAEPPCTRFCWHSS